MGWDIERAREVKARVAGQAAIWAAQGAAADQVDAVTSAQQPTANGDTDEDVTPPVSLGLRPLPDGSFGLAVRYRLDRSDAREVAQRIAAEAGADGPDDVQVLGVGPVVPLTDLPELPEPPEGGLEEGLREQARPLRPGVSIAHESVTAGTLGAVVHRDGVPYLLSNHHVLVGDAGVRGDAVLQPGPADGGTAQDAVGALADWVELRPGQVALADAALADLSGLVEPGQSPLDAVRAVYPGGAVTGVAAVRGGEQVEKIGRTTGITRGVVSAIEMDGVQVNFGGSLGVLTFDGQIEIDSSAAGPFSQGGDSGSLVYLAEEAPANERGVGLLFAGSEQGGSQGWGLTYLNPLGRVLDLLGVQLWAPEQEDGDRQDDSDRQDEEATDGSEAWEQPDVPDEPEWRRRQAEVAGLPGVCGVGLRHEGSRAVLVVNVEDEATIERLPAEVRAEADVRVTGPIELR